MAQIEGYSVISLPSVQFVNITLISYNSLQHHRQWLKFCGYVVWFCGYLWLCGQAAFTFTAAAC